MSSSSLFFDGGATAVGAIVGIVIACIALACCMFWVVYCIYQTRTPRYRDSFPEYDLQAYTYPPPPPPSLYPLQPQGYNSSPNAPSYPGMYGRDPMEQPPLAQASAVQNSAPIYVSTPVYPASKN